MAFAISDEGPATAGILRTGGRLVTRVIGRRGNLDQKLDDLANRISTDRRLIQERVQREVEQLRERVQDLETLQEQPSNVVGDSALFGIFDP